MAIDNRPNFGTTLLKGMLDREQMTIEKDKLKLAQQTQKMQQEAFELEVQKQQWELARELATGRVASAAAAGLKGPQGDAFRALAAQGGPTAAAALPQIQVERQVQEAIAGREDEQAHALEVQQERIGAAESLADKNIAANKELEGLRQRFEKGERTREMLFQGFTLAASLAGQRQEAKLMYEERGYDPAAAALLSGSSGNVQTDTEMFMQQIRSAALGDDPSALSVLTSGQAQVTKGMQIAQGNGMEPKIANPLAQFLNTSMAKGEVPSQDEIAQHMDDIAEMGENNKKEIATRAGAKGKEAKATAVDEWIQRQRQLVLIAIETAFNDPELVEEFIDDEYIQNQVDFRAVATEEKRRMDALMSDLARRTSIPGIPNPTRP